MSFRYKNIVILTGAGISAESGINTFRAASGLWEDHRIEDVATPEGYRKDPSLVQSFYNQRRASLHNPKIQPNPAHLALASLEDQIDGNVLIVTQNVDNLHERAGSKNIIHMHGELLKARCPKSDQVFEHIGDLSESDRCQCCQNSNPLRPHIVWFGEIPLQMDEIYHALKEADLFIAIGTSGVVYPAAGFVQDASIHGAHTIEINIEPSEVQSEFIEKRYGKASIEVPKLVQELLSES